MTLPRERTNALINTRNFMRKLLDREKSPRLPKWVREEAYWCLRHYPWDMHLEKSALALPDVWEYECEEIKQPVNKKHKRRKK